MKRTVDQGAWTRYRCNCDKSSANDAERFDVRVNLKAFIMVIRGDEANWWRLDFGGIPNRNNAASSSCEPSARAEDAEVAPRVGEANVFMLR